MKFFERDLCEKLVELGCLTDSNQGLSAIIVGDKIKWMKRLEEFTLYDFIAPTERARKNCEIICKFEGHGFHDDFRNALMQRASELEAEQMIRKAVGL
jgi:hypothetical protein